MSADADRVARALAEDLDAGFVELFDSYRSMVFSVALRMSGRWADAEDLTAEAFLRAFRALSDYSNERIAGLRLRPWMLTIVMNLGRNRWRTNARKPPPDGLDALDLASGGGDSSGSDRRDSASQDEAVEDTVLRHETSTELAGLLGLLAEEQRAAVVLRHVVDLPIGEISTVLGIPQGTVKSHISRGLQRLRDLTTAEEVSDAEIP